MGLYGRNVGVNELVTLDRFRQVSGRGTTRAVFWLEKFRVRDD